MTLGEKLKEVRKQAGFSQEQLSEKLGVSRSAVVKWETDNGEAIDELVIREAYNLSEYGKGSKKTKKDRAVRDKFPGTKIYTLLGEMKLTKSEKVIDNALGFLTDAPFGIPALINGMKNPDKEFYLVEKDGKQLLVTVTNEFIETRQLAKEINGKKFEIGNWKFTRCANEVKI